MFAPTVIKNYQRRWNLLVTNQNKLRTMSKEWSGKIDELGSIVDNMHSVMEKHKGVGISAIQIGVPFRIFLAGHINRPELFINPKIEKLSPYKKSDFEGCLSCPNIMVKIKRPSYIIISYTSVREGDYVKIRRKFTDFDARVVQHEIDHLNGYLITDRGKVYRP